MRSGFPAHAGQSCRRREIIRLDVAGARARPDLPAVDTRRAADAVGLRGGRRGGDGVRAQRPYTQIRCADQRERRRHRPGLGARPAPADAERHRRGFACWRRRRSGISVRAVGERGGARRVGWRRPGRPCTGAAAGAGFGFEVDEQTHVARADAQSDLLAAQAPFASDRDSIRELSLAIAMVMAAGIRRNNIRSALRVSHELAHGEENKA